MASTIHHWTNLIGAHEAEALLTHAVLNWSMPVAGPLSISAAGGAWPISGDELARWERHNDTKR